MHDEQRVAILDVAVHGELAGLRVVLHPIGLDLAIALLHLHVAREYGIAVDAERGFVTRYTDRRPRKLGRALHRDQGL